MTTLDPGLLSGGESLTKIESDLLSGLHRYAQRSQRRRCWTRRSGPGSKLGRWSADSRGVPDGVAYGDAESRRQVPTRCQVARCPYHRLLDLEAVTLICLLELTN